MLDVNFSKLFSIEATLPENTSSSSKALLIKACKVYIFDNERIYSEFEDQTFDTLNDNNGYGAMDVEFVLENNYLGRGYPRFATKCFVMRTDTYFLLKPMKFSNSTSCSKINQNGEIVIGIRYFFRSEGEMEKMINCKSLLVEGFIALGKHTNIFGLMCQLKKEKKGWKITSAYTYKPKYAKNIKYLID